MSLDTSFLGPFDVGFDVRPEFTLRQKLGARRLVRVESIDIERDLPIDTSDPGVETGLFPWRKRSAQDGGPGAMAHWREVFPAISGWVRPNPVSPGPGKLTLIADPKNLVDPLSPPVVEGYFALEDANDVAALELRSDVYAAGNVPLPSGWPCLVVRGVHDHEERLLAFGAGGPLVAQHRGQQIHRFSTPVHDLRGRSLGRRAGLHSAWRVSLDANNRNSLAWNLTPSAGDETGEGLSVGVGEIDPRETITPEGLLTLAYASWTRGGPLHPGAAVRDRHQITVNKNGEPINPLHLWMYAQWFVDPEKDGQLAYEDDPWLTGADYPFTARVHFRWNPFERRFGWFSSSLFSEITTPPTTPPTPPTTPPNIPVPIDERVDNFVPPTPPPINPPNIPNGPDPPEDPDDKIGEPIFGLGEETDRRRFGDDTRRPDRGGRGRGGGDEGGRVDDGTTPFDDRLDQLDERDEAERDARRDQKRGEQDDKRKGNQEEGENEETPPKLRKESDLNDVEKSELNRLDTIIEGLRRDRRNGKLDLETYFRLFQHYNGLRKKLLQEPQDGTAKNFQLELDALTRDFGAGLFTPEEFRRRRRDLRRRFKEHIEGVVFPTGGVEIDRRIRTADPTTQFGPAISGGAIATVDTFDLVIDPDGVVATVGRFGQNFRAPQVQPLGAHWQTAGRVTGGNWNRTTKEGELLRQGTVDSVNWKLPPEMSIEEVEQNPDGTVAGYSSIGLGIHGAGVFGMGVSSKGINTAPEIWNGFDIRLSGNSGVRKTTVRGIDAAGASAPGNQWSFELELVTDSGVNRGGEASVTIAANQIAKQNAYTHVVGGAGPLRNITGGADGDEIAVRVATGALPLQVDHLTGGGNIATQTGAPFTFTRADQIVTLQRFTEGGNTFWSFRCC